MLAPRQGLPARRHTAGRMYGAHPRPARYFAPSGRIAAAVSASFSLKEKTGNHRDFRFYCFIYVFLLLYFAAAENEPLERRQNGVPLPEAD